MTRRIVRDCAGCGEDSARVRWCGSKDCLRAYLEYRFHELVEYTDDHWIWTGPFDSKAGRKVPAVPGRIRENGRWKGLRPRARTMAFQLAGLRTSKGITIEPDCGEERCVRPDHMTLLERRGDHQDHGVYFPAEPLLARVERVWSEKVSTDDPNYPRLEGYVLTGRKKGRLSVGAVDALSIKVLGLHPCLVYGDQWFDVSDLEGAA